MLQVAVHHGKDIRIARSHPLKAGRGESTASDASNEPHPRIFAGQPQENFERAVLRIVINENDLPTVAGEKFFQKFNNKRYVIALVVGRNDDGIFQISANFNLKADTLFCRRYLKKTSIFLLLLNL